MSLVVLLTHRGDFFTIDRVQAALERRGAQALRVDSDRFPAGLAVAARFRGGVLQARLEGDGLDVDLAAVDAVWMRRLWPSTGLEQLEPRWRELCRHHAQVALTQLLPLLDSARWLDRIDLQLAAESKPRQLLEAARVGLTVPDTLLSNAPAAVREFATQQRAALITKLLEPLSYDMRGGRGDFMYTSRVSAEELGRLEGLRWMPQLFQPEIVKARELRVVMVGSRCFVGAIDTRGWSRAAVDWRRLRADEGPAWEHAELPAKVAAQCRALLDRFGLSFGALDFIVTPAGEHVFLELNPAGEWGWLERDLELPISEAIAEWLLGADEAERAPAPAVAPVVLASTPRASRSDVLIVTHGGDNECIESVSAAIRARGGRPLRLNTDRYPVDVGLSTLQGRSGTGLVVIEGEAVTLETLAAVWYRRFAAGVGLPAMGDTREAAVGESRRALFGTIANLRCFQLDHLAAVRRAHHKELQLRLAAELGLEVPRTLVTNRAEDAREFWHRLEGRVVTKMQHSFAIYREGRENVVFTSRVSEADLADLDGLRLCPMTFQEELPKQLELRVTIVGRRVMAASIDSRRSRVTEVDWRRDGLGIIDDWQPYALPEAVSEGLLALQRRLGLNYGAADVILTPDGRHVFLEVNPVGEFFWLERSPGLPISDAIAGVLLGQEPRNVARLWPA